MSTTARDHGSEKGNYRITGTRHGKRRQRGLRTETMSQGEEEAKDYENTNTYLIFNWNWLLKADENFTMAGIHGFVA